MRRAWAAGALPVGLMSALVNIGLGWVSYRWAISEKTLQSDIFVSIAITTWLNYVMGRQWGAADFKAGRISIRADLRLPAKVRIGPQGAVFSAVATLLVVDVVGHLLGGPPGLVGALSLRGLSGGLAGAAAFALGACGGALNAQAQVVESG